MLCSASDTMQSESTPEPVLGTHTYNRALDGFSSPRLRAINGAYARGSGQSTGDFIHSNSLDNPYSLPMNNPQGEDAGTAGASHSLQPRVIAGMPFSRSMPDMPVQHHGISQPQEQHHQHHLPLHSTGSIVPADAEPSSTRRLPAHNPYVGTFSRAPAAAADANLGSKRQSPSTSAGSEDLSRFLRQVI